MDPNLSLDRMILERAGLYAALLALDEEALTTTPLCGTWTAKDVLAHIAGWESRFARCLGDLLAGRGMQIVDVPDVDAYNAELVAQRRATPLAGVLAELEQALDAAIAALDGQPAEDLARPQRVPWGEVSAAGWARMEAEHDAEHTAATLAWRQAAHPARLPGPRCLLAAAVRDASWAVERLVGRLPAAARDTAPLCGTWTAKDVVGHLADWTTTVAVAAAQASQMGVLPSLPESDEAVDAWNAGHAAARRAQPWPVVWAAYDTACRTVLATLEALSEEELAHPYPNAMPATPYEWLAITGHDVEHAHQIAAWLEQEGS